MSSEGFCAYCGKRLTHEQLAERSPCCCERHDRNWDAWRTRQKLAIVEFSRQRTSEHYSPHRAKRQNNIPRQPANYPSECLLASEGHSQLYGRALALFSEAVPSDVARHQFRVCLSPIFAMSTQIVDRSTGERYALDTAAAGKAMVSAQQMVTELVEDVDAAREILQSLVELRDYHYVPPDA